MADGNRTSALAGHIEPGARGGGADAAPGIVISERRPAAMCLVNGGGGIALGIGADARVGRVSDGDGWEALGTGPGQWLVVSGADGADDPLRPRLERTKEEQGLANVELLRSRSYGEYARLLVTADVFLFPSRIEGLPRVTLEAAQFRGIG